jgi:succinyl-diaminopimelate desuccinylase
MENYLKHLISMPTVSSDKAANTKALDYLQDFFEGRGLHIMRYAFSGSSSLVATTKKDSKTPKVMLVAHMDVVPGPDELFTLREDDTKFFGRGVFDMKFAIASYMQVVDTLNDNLDSYDIGIMVTTDEELGGLEGTKRLVDMGYKPEVCILPDGAQDWQIETFAKGFLYGNISVEGTTAHGSRPWEGDSATFKLVDLLGEIKTYFADQTLNTNTLNIGIISGGEAKNQIPAHASAALDIRFLSEADRAKIVTIIESLCQKYNATYSEEPLEGHPCINELDHPLIEPFTESITKITGQEVSGTISFGSSDARFFAGIGVPSIISRPHGGGQHSADEWIDKQGCLQYPEVLVDYLQKVAR